PVMTLTAVLAAVASGGGSAVAVAAVLQLLGGRVTLVQIRNGLHDAVVILGYVDGANGVIVQVLHQVGIVNFDPTVATITSGSGVAVVLLSKVIDSRSWTAIQVAASQPTVVASTPLLSVSSGVGKNEAPPSPEPPPAVASVAPVQLPPPASATS